jgi:hypothetical protein
MRRALWIPWVLAMVVVAPAVAALGALAALAGRLEPEATPWSPGARSAGGRERGRGSRRWTHAGGEGCRPAGEQRPPDHAAPPSPLDR